MVPAQNRLNRLPPGLTRRAELSVGTVNEVERPQRLLSPAIDGIMTDHIDTLRTVLTGRGAWA
jgi:glycerophosphoryl diester phosphodiesterase